MTLVKQIRLDLQETSITIRTRKHETQIDAERRVIIDAFNRIQDLWHPTKQEINYIKAVIAKMTDPGEIKLAQKRLQKLLKPPKPNKKLRSLIMGKNKYFNKEIQKEIEKMVADPGFMSNSPY